MKLKHILNDWRDFAGVSYFEIPIENLTEAVIATEIDAIIDRVQLPFKNTISALDGSFLRFEITTKMLHQTTNEFIVRGQNLPDGMIVIQIKKQYQTESELTKFKEELGPLLHHELTHYFQLQKTTFRLKKVVSNMKQYLALTDEIMAYANQASKMVSISEFNEIISKCVFDDEQTLPNIMMNHGSDNLFKNGKGFIWLYFIWFKKSDQVRKRFVKYFMEYTQLK